MKSKTPTKRQTDTLRAIAKLTKELGFPPTYGEIAAELKINSDFAVRNHVAELIAKGYVSMKPNGARTIRVLKAA